MKQANALANGVRLPERRSIAGEILPVVTPPGRIGQITLAAATRSSSGHLKDAYRLGCSDQPRFALRAEVPMQRDAARLVFIGVVGLGPQRGKPFLEMRGDFLVSGLAVEVVRLVRIGLKIVELELLRLDERSGSVCTAPSARRGRGAHSRIRDIRSTRRASLSAMGCGLAFGQREHALALHLGWEPASPAISSRVGARSRFRTISSDFVPAFTRPG